MAIGNVGLGNLIVTLGVDTSGLNVAIQAVKNLKDQVTSDVGKINAELERVSNQFQRFGSAATRYMTVPLTLAGGAAIKMANDLEYTSQKIVALAGVGQSQVDAWKSKMVSLSNDTGVSQKNIAETLYYVASAGIRAKEALEITEMSAKASAAGLGNMSDTGRLLTYAINAYGKENITASQAVDALTVAVREGTAEANTMVSVIGDLIPVASAMGVSFQEVTGSVAAMTRTGFNAHKSATALRQIMVSLLHPTHESKEALATWSKALGDSSYTAEGLRKTIREKGLIEALIKIDELTKKFGQSAAGIVFGNVRALTGDLSLVGKNMQAAYEIIQKSKEETGAFQNAWGIMTQTTAFKLNQMKSAAQNAFIALGQSMQGPLIAVLDDLTKGIKNLTSWWKGLSDVTQEWIIKIGALLAVIGPVAMAISGLIKIYSGLRVAVILVVDAFKAVQAVVLSSMNVIISTVRALASLITVTAADIAGAIGIALPMLAAVGVIIWGLANHFGWFKDNVDAATQSAYRFIETQRMLRDVSVTTQQAVVAQKVELEKLVKIASSEYSSMQQKKSAIESINKISPEYLGNITEEAIRTGQATSAINRYISALMLKAKAEAAQETLVSIEKQRIADLMSGADKSLSVWQKVVATMVSLADPTGKLNYGTLTSNMMKSNAKESEAIYKEQTVELQKMLVQLNTQIDFHEHIKTAIELEKESVSKLSNSWVDANKNAIVFEGTIDSIRNKLKIVPESFQEQMQRIQTSGKKNVEGSTDETNNGLEPPSHKKTALEKLAEGESRISVMNTVLGGQFDALSEKVQLYNSVLEQLAEESGNKVTPKIVELANKLNSIKAEQLTQSISNITTLESLLGVSFDETGAKLEVYNNKLKDAQKFPNVLGNEIVNLQNKINELTLTQILEGVSKSLREASLSAELSGNSFVSAAEKARVYKDALTNMQGKNLEKTPEFQQLKIQFFQESDSAAMEKLNEDFKKLQDSAISLKSTVSSEDMFNTLKGNLLALPPLLNRTSNSFREMSGAMQLTQSLALYEVEVKARKQAQQDAESSGKAYEQATVDAQVYGAVINWLRQQAETPWVTTTIDEFLKKLKAANIDINEEKSIKKLARIAEESFQQFGNLLSAYGQLVDAKQQRAEAAIEKTAKAEHKSAKWVAKEKEKIEAEYARKKKQTAIAEAIINGAVAVTQALANPGLPWAIPLFAVIAATTAMQIAAISGAPMAEGGVVPPGYPNDTYFARLTSGETVVPPGKLPDLSDIKRRGSSSGTRTIRLELDGRTAVALIDEQELFNSTF